MAITYSAEQLASIRIPALNFAPANYNQQLQEKTAALAPIFAHLDMPDLQVFASPPLHFRMRAEFRIWHAHSLLNGEKISECYYAMFERDAPKTPIRIDHFPIACNAICERMTPLLEALNQSKALAHKLFQVEFLASTTGQVVVTLVYHRQLDATWQARAKVLEENLDAAIIGRARKQKIVLSRDYVIEKLNVDGRELAYEQKENSFSQPNAFINQAMIEWVTEYLAQHPKHTGNQFDHDDFIELYCGNGNFTLPLARYFRRAIGTEISKTSIASAQRNCTLNQIDNIDFVRLSGAETASALRREREFRRLRHIDLDTYNISTVLVDPPRAGLDPATLEFIAQFDTIIYISCNPLTLADNLATLTDSHSMVVAAAFDQFPYSAHCECGVILEQRA